MKYILLIINFFILNKYNNGFYLPGVQMVTYKKGDQIQLYVNSYTSSDTLLPIDYYKLPMCRPEKLEFESENLGQYLTANRIQTSPFNIKFLEKRKCSVLCIKEYDYKQIKEYDEMIKDNYRVHWILDNLPVATEDSEGIHELGFSLGLFNEEIQKVSQLNNHFLIKIGYNVPKGYTVDDYGGRIVDFIVYPFSFDYKQSNFDKDGNIIECDRSIDLNPLHLTTTKDAKTKLTKIYWTYSVEWIEMPDKEWRTRWDVYFEVGSGNDEVHWFSIINALLVVLFLSGMVGMILMRSLHRDISRYNRIPTEEERQEEKEESGWKLVHADVFRPPVIHPMLFCVFIGTGYQVFGMTIITLIFAAVGFLSPSNRGNLMVALIVCFILMGTAAGYGSSQMYKLFKGKKWQRCTILTGLLFPGIVFGVFFLLNLFAWGAGSDAAVPFGSMILVVFLWFGISVPLVFFGSWIGYRRPTITFPVATSNIPRPIPQQAWYMSNISTCVIGGILPFGAIFVELFFVLTSLWTDKYYYVFGFLLLAIVILLGTCAEITIVLCYFQLCAEDYNWWWRSILVSGSCGIYVFLYSAYYFATRLDVHNFIGAMLYFGYMFLISFSIFIVTGTIGNMACLWFTRKIYASIKVD